jgi:PIN domain nuclease of toxin-antitoxin system
MEYLADTVALIRHLSGTGRIGKAAKEILKAADQGEHIIYISIISMVEIIKSDNYHIIDLDMEIVETAKEISK